MAVRRILIVEDEATLRRIVADAIELAGYEVAVAEDGEEGLRLFEGGHFDLVVADIMMPRMDGFQMVRRMRQLHPKTQFLFLSARSSSDDVVEGFRSGGHDYLRKPFAMNELMVRVEALLSRIEETSADVCDEYRVGEYLFDVKHASLSRNGEVERLSARECAILLALVRNEGRVVSSRTMLLDIWGDDSYYNLRSLNVFVSRLRSRLAHDASIAIISVRGVGYKLLCGY